MLEQVSISSAIIILYILYIPWLKTTRRLDSYLTELAFSIPELAANIPRLTHQRADSDSTTELAENIPRLTRSG